MRVCAFEKLCKRKIIVIPSLVSDHQSGITGVKNEENKEQNNNDLWIDAYKF